MAPFAPNITALVLLRLVQGLGAAAGIVLGRAIARDMFDGPELGRVLARLVIATGSTAIVAPLVGALLLRITDWRGIMVALTVAGLILVIATVLVIPETAPNEARGPDEARLWRVWRTVLREPRFGVYAAIFVTGSAVLFTYLTFISIVMQNERGADPLSFSLFFALNAAAIIAGGQLAAALVRRVGIRAVLLAALCWAVLGAAAVACAGAFGWSDWGFHVAMFLTSMPLGAIMPLSAALALQPLRAGVGAAAAVAGGLQYLVGGALPWAATAIFGSSGTTMGYTMLGCAVVALGIALPAGRLDRGRDPTGDVERTDGAARPLPPPAELGR